MPTNTTSTAAYVAVATNVSELLARIPTDIIAANSVTARETVIKLLVLCTEGRLIISIGTTSAAPPVKAMMNRVNLSTNGETFCGGKSCRYSSIRLSISALVYVRRRGRTALRKLRIGSEGIPGFDERLQYRELNGSPAKSSISGNAWERSRRSLNACDSPIFLDDRTWE